MASSSKSKKLHSCQLCDMKFQSHVGVLLHTRTHAGITYECPFCDAKFTQKGSVTLHLVTHTGERPFNCKKCPRTFSRKGNLKTHMEQIHSSKRRVWPCDLCDKKCSTAHGLNLHIMIHTGERPFKCEDCLQRFRAKHDLKRHEIKGTCNKEGEIHRVANVGRKEKGGAPKIRGPRKNRISDQVPPPNTDNVGYEAADDNANQFIYECGLCFASFGCSGELVTHLGRHKNEHNLENCEDFFLAPFPTRPNFLMWQKNKPFLPSANNLVDDIPMQVLSRPPKSTEENRDVFLDEISFADCAAF